MSNKKGVILKKLLKENFSQIIFTILVLFFLVNMIIFPAKFIQVGLNGISAWAFNVLPSVLPFMFFTRVLSSLGQIEKLPFGKFTRKVFGTPSISFYTFLMAILSGYPVGSKMIADSYEMGKITRNDAFRMSSFCSTSGPMFIIGAVGVGMFHSAQIGYILFISHVLSALINGIIYKKIKVKEEEVKNIKEVEEKKFNLSDIVLSSTLSILSVGAIIAIFFVIIECFSPIFSLLPKDVAYFLQGVIEITKGCLSLSTLSNVKLGVILASFVISFGGISTLIQSITLLNKVKMPVRLFALQKLTHGIISALITLALVFIFL